MCNGNNHYSGCECGFGGTGHKGRRTYGNSYTHIHRTSYLFGEVDESLSDYIKRGRDAFQRAEYETAYKSFREALTELATTDIVSLIDAKNVKRINYMLCIYEACIQLGRHEEAEYWHQLAIYGVVTNIGWSNDSIEIRIGDQYLSAGKNSEAQEWYNRVIYSTEKAPSERAKAFNAKGIAHLRLQQYEEAYNCLRTAIELAAENHPKYDVYLLNIANVCLSLKRYKESQDWYTTALNRSLSIGNTAKSHNGLGLTHYYLGEFDSARAEFKQAFDTENAECGDKYVYLLNLANSYLRLGLHYEAKKLYEEIISSDYARDETKKSARKSLEALISSSNTSTSAG